METIDQIRVVLHLIADVLVWPVFAGLLLSAAITLVVAGGCAREAWDRKRARRNILTGGCDALSGAVRAPKEGSAALALEHVLQDLERRSWRGVMRVRLMVRVGPALGLMGTLIPMAYALQGLSDGNLPDLAGNLVTAFAATVIGLAISVVAYLIAAVREEWVRADLQALGLHAEALLQQEVPHGA